METKIRTLGTLHAKNFRVDLDEVADESGGATRRRVVIRHPSAVTVIPLVSPTQALMVRQYRYALGRETLEFPAGKLQSGETAEEAARRELLEETGHEAGTLTRILKFAPADGYSDEIIHVFVARGLRVVDGMVLDDEISRVEILDLARLKALIAAGDIIDGVTIASLAAYEWLGARAESA